MPVNLTNYAMPTNIVNFTGFFSYLDTVTSGFFGVFSVIFLASVVFLATGNFPKERSFALASLVALITSTFYYAVGVGYTPMLVVSVIATLISFFLLFKSTDQ